ncbi:Hypothetical protein I595_2980 [Croceitalea dokdonensis DOKDO 023]|uniref:Tetratricopeptide repeat protein n=1 Tax=Croceitalea dokdonensis DOKDO 023 TaxID=1300341 RepID=A0A0P7ASS5_9FLAO|nr:hypothetical protein [Croceitalea dokdonensis]KPM31001.1 Hypothetical protein I595_2980 [Croceitalea dokdonensis DOKDO 023]
MNLGLNRLIKRRNWSFTLTFCIAIAYSYGQETPKVVQQEESSEVFLEEYTDEFQETFFEALKQKGIQNYDRAINLLLDCKRLQPKNDVIDHELAKTYLLDRKYTQGQPYAIAALQASIENYWYLDTLMELLAKQSMDFGSVANQLPSDNEGFRKNLALIYYKRQAYDAATKVLNNLGNSDFKARLQQKLAEVAVKTETTQFKTATFEVNNDPVKALELNLGQQLKLGQYRMVEMRAKKAVELYPLQPFFYYAYGVSLHHNNKNNQAIDVLISGLDFLFDDIPLANKFHKALADAYTKANNISKANEYLRKIKSGF